MKSSPFHLLGSASRRFRAIGAALALSSVGLAAQTTDLATAPLVTASSTSVRPNILFILDDSGSMAWLFMPDQANNFNGYEYGFVSSQCNGVYYDPAITYAPPLKADGTSFPNAVFTAAHNNGFDTTSPKVNLSTSFDPDDEPGGDNGGNYGAGPAFYYRYSGTQTSREQKNYFSTSSTFYRECNSDIGVAPGSSVFTYVAVGAAERTNFANWFSYYRTRMLMAKSASGFAFRGIDSRYRVGFMSINNATPPSFLNIEKFDDAQKDAWYTKLYSANTGSSTPLRQALSRAGNIYARKITSLYGVTIKDPIEYSCQQNFSILTTDGYWNGAAGFKLDNSAMDNQDSSEPRPRFDGAAAERKRVVTTTVTRTPTTRITARSDNTVVESRDNYTRTVRTTPWTRTLQTVLPRTGGNACNVATSDPPSGCLQDNRANTENRNRRWCVTTNTTPTSAAQCIAMGASNALRVCRGTGSSSTLPSGGNTCQTDGAGVKWCIYDASALPSPDTSCVRVTTGNNLFYCRAPAPTYRVTTQNQTYSQTLTSTTTQGTNRTTVTRTQTTQTDVAVSTRVITKLDGVVISDITTPTSEPGMPSTASSVTSDGTVNVGMPSVSNVDTGSPTASTAWSNSGSATTSACTTSIPTTSPPTPAGTAIPSTPESGTVGGPSAVAVVPSSVVTSSGLPGTRVDVASSTTVGAATVTGPTDVETTIPAVAGTSGTLSDVAQYYYANDLRTSALGNATGALGTDVSENNVPSSGLDSASWQHMTTFTLGIGALGRMTYTQSYESDARGDFFDVKNGSIANPSAGICRWQSAGTVCNWPVPTENNPETIDDLWHAAVNGRGGFFAASNPTSMATGIANALAGVSARTGSSAAATTSNPNVTSGDNFVFESTFTTNDWTGQLVRKQLDLTTGVVKATTDWSAADQLNANTSRTLYTRDGGATNGLKPFAWASLTATEQGYFSLASISTLSQFCTGAAPCLPAATQSAAAGQALVEFLAGSRENEGQISDTAKYFRQRAGLLGDIVSAEAVFVRGSPFSYTDAGYGDFRAANGTRAGTVYVAANDGMLHAFNAETGAERWAYVPGLVLPTMFRLADKDYANRHRYFLDGTPVIQDVYDGTNWRTILVAGMAGGGRGYYALDVTDPERPKSLWEYTDTNLGFTYGNPEIAKLRNGTWAVMFSSGYNNVSPGDGVGRLYVLNAVTGALIRTISTGAGSSTAPSGLGRIRAWVNEADTNNTVERIYGGDLLGNLWRFDVNAAEASGTDIGAAGYDAHRLVTFQDPAGTAQPVTSRPDIGELDGRAIILVGTGRYLGSTDLANTQRQTFYAVKDTLGATSLSSPRTTGSGFKAQVQTQGTCPATAPASVCRTGEIIRTSTDNPVDYATDNGWYVDLIDTGERASTDVQLAFGTVVFNTNVPNVSACTVGGYSNRYFLDFRTGGVVKTAAGVAGVRLGNALATRPVIVRLPNNTIVALSRLSDGMTVTTNVPIGPSGGTTRRVSWRELVDGQQ